MDLPSLRAFLALVELRDPNRAARKCGVQPRTFGGMLEALERELGISLFDQSSSNFSLTKDGAAFRERIEPLVVGLERAFIDTKKGMSDSTPPTGDPLPLRYALSPKFGLALAENAVKRLEMEPVSFPLSPAKWQPALLQNSLDVAFGTLPVRPPEFRSAPLSTSRWTLVFPQSHEFTNSDEITAESIEGRPLIFFEREENPDLYDSTLSKFARNGIKTRVMMDVPDHASGMRLTQDDLGMYLVAEYEAFELEAGLVRRPLTGEAAEIIIGAVWHEQNRSSALSEVLQLLKISVDTRQ